MAYVAGTLDATLAAAAGDDPDLFAELRVAFIDSLTRQLDLLGRARCDGNWRLRDAAQGPGFELQCRTTAVAGGGSDRGRAGRAIGRPQDQKLSRRIFSGLTPRAWHRPVLCLEAPQLPEYRQLRVALLAMMEPAGAGQTAPRAFLRVGGATLARHSWASPKHSSASA
jgi:hypothetical protein